MPSLQTISLVLEQYRGSLKNTAKYLCLVFLKPWIHFYSAHFHSLIVIHVGPIIQEWLLFKGAMVKAKYESEIQRN